MFGLGTPELVVILLIVVLLFGGRKIPEIMKGLGQGLREFKSASSGDSKKRAPELDEPADDASSDDTD